MSSRSIIVSGSTTNSGSLQVHNRLTSVSGLQPRVVICRDMGPDVMPLLTSRKDLEIILWPEDSVCDRQWLLDNISGATGLLVMLTDKVDAEVLDAAGSSLKVVSTMSVGFEHIDLKAIAQRNIKVGYTPDVLTEAVADLSVMLALMAGRNAGESLTLVKDGRWPGWAPFGLCGRQLSPTTTAPTRTAGFIGFGRISRAVLSRLIPFGITHCIYTPDPSSAPNIERDRRILNEYGGKLQSLRRVDLDELARDSDVLFVLAPGGDATKHIINEDFLKKMKKTSVLVNTSRGTLVHSDALAKALREGWIWGAGVDVVEGEPNINGDHPLVKEPRCVVLPHIGSATFETRIGMATLAVENLLGGVFGETMPADLDVQGCL